MICDSRHLGDNANVLQLVVVSALKFLASQRQPGPCFLSDAGYCVAHR